MDNCFLFNCPHCGSQYHILDYIEVCDMFGDFAMICEECERMFNVSFATTIDIEVSYTE